MFKPFSQPESEYDKQIRRVIRELETSEPGSDQYGKLLDRLQKLQKMRAEDRPDRPSADTLAQVSANLIGMLLIIQYERVHVISTKALGFIPRTK